MSSSCTVKISMENYLAHIELQGQLTEESTLPSAPKEAKAAIVDISQVNYINSTGTRQWLLWNKALRESLLAAAGSDDTKGVLQIQGAPLAFLRLLSLVNGMIPEGAILSSFFLSYSCLECAKINHIEIQNRPDPDQLHELLNGAASPPCPECGSETELEIEPRFYRSLSQYAPK